MDTLYPPREYFDLETGILVAYNCHGQEYRRRYIKNRYRSSESYTVASEIDFLDKMEELTPIFALFEEDFKTLNRGKIWNGPFQVSLDKWIKME